MWSSNDLEIKIPRRQTKTEKFQQKILGDPKRVFLLKSCQPIPLRRSEGRISQKMWHHSFTGEQLVWQQKNQVQEEHRQGPRRGQHVRSQSSRSLCGTRRKFAMGRKSISRKWWGRRRIWLPKLLKTNQVSTMLQKNNFVYNCWHKPTFFREFYKTKEMSKLGHNATAEM